VIRLGDASFVSVLNGGAAEPQHLNLDSKLEHDRATKFCRTDVTLRRYATRGYVHTGRPNGSISPNSLASWLHGVAFRVSRKAKVATARRCRHEQLAARGTNAGHEPGHEVVSIVREEIDRLPEPLRVPVYLCYFEGETYEVAARHMQVTESAIRGRLARARDVLRERLSRRGVGDPTVLPSVFTTRLVTRAVPLALVRATTRAAMSIAQGCGRLVGVSAIVSELTEGVLLKMIEMKLKTAALGFAATGGIPAGGRARRAEAGAAVPLGGEQDEETFRTADDAVRGPEDDPASCPGSGREHAGLLP
jgi:hypothetical protein